MPRVDRMDQPPAYQHAQGQQSSQEEVWTTQYESINTRTQHTSGSYEAHSSASLSGTLTATSDDGEEEQQRPRPHSVVMESEEADDIRRIATRLSRADSRATNNSRPGELEVNDFDDSDPALQPQSKAFDPEKWVRRMIERFAAEGKHAYRTGVKFTNLSVSGSAPAIQLQQTVSSYLRAPLNPGEFLSLGKNKPHKQILRQFNGLIKPGELLIVLGRPGSGCSTLLKTMTGELHGLNLDEGSHISYNGIPQKQMMKEFKGEAIYNQEGECSRVNLHYHLDSRELLT